MVRGGVVGWPRWSAALALAVVLLVTVGATGAQAQAAADVWEPGPVNRTPVGGPPPSAPEGARPDGGGVVAEFEGRRTAESKTFRLADGGLQTVVNAERVHYKDRDGRWQPIDLTLVDGSAGGRAKHRTRANDVALEIPVSRRV